MPVETPSVEDLTLLDMEPLTSAELANIAEALLKKMNTMGQSRLTTEETVMLRLIRTCFEV